jgi:hypothetical protein
MDMSWGLYNLMDIACYTPRYLITPHSGFGFQICNAHISVKILDIYRDGAKFQKQLQGHRLQTLDESICFIAKSAKQ